MNDLMLGDLVLFNDDVIYKDGKVEIYKIMAVEHKKDLFFVDNKWVKPNRIRKYEAPIIQQIKTTLPTESKERKNYPLFRGCLRYFPAALAGIAKTSQLGNIKHNPGKELHHARGKSVDHGDCILRHLIDTEDLLAALNRGQSNVTQQDVLLEVNQMAWRVLAFSQELHEKFGAPLAPGAIKEEKYNIIPVELTQDQKDLFCEMTKRELSLAIKKMTEGLNRDLENE